MLASHCPHFFSGLSDRSSVRVPRSVPSTPPTYVADFPSFSPQRYYTMTTPTLPAIPTRRTTSLVPVQPRQRDTNRPYFTNEEQGVVWANLKATFEGQLDELIALVGEEQAQKLVLGRYERVHQWTITMYLLLDFDVILAKTQPVKQIRDAETEAADKAMSHYLASLADALKRENNARAINTKGMGREKRSELFGWMKRILNLDDNDQSFFMGNRFDNEARQNWYTLVENYWFFFQNLKFLVYKHWQQVVKEAGEDITDEQTKALEDAEQAYVSYRDALRLFKSNMRDAGLCDHISWLERELKGELADSKRDKHTSDLEKAQAQLAKLRGETVEEEAPQAEPETEAAEVAAAG